MPKKYKQKSLLTKPTSSAPSNLTLSRASTTQNEPTTKTVNDLIRESRRSMGLESPQQPQTASSIPPALRAVLDIPAPSPPPARFGIRGPTRLRRIPGPPPPRSWLTDSVHAPPRSGVLWSRAHERTRIQRQSSILPGGWFPVDGSLQGVILKRMAMDWSWHVEYDHEYLAELPVKIKQTLLSYIAIYSEGRGPNPLHLLFPLDLDVTEASEVRRLDLDGAVGGWSTLRKIEKDLEVERRSIVSSTRLPLDIPDAWDEDEARPIPTSISDGTRFQNLKHLSLAVNPGTKGPVANWAGLLTLTAKLSTITSLSLAYWPQPTYTPNASTSLVKVKTTTGSAPRVTYGGTNAYSEFDRDWREAAGILKTLSRSLYCLKWLDLTGCGAWFPALTWESSENEEMSFSNVGPDWNGSWRGIEHLVLAVGWSPGPEPEEPEEPSRDTAGDGSPRASDTLARLSALRLGAQVQREDAQPEAWNVEHERKKYYHRLEVERYKEVVSRARVVAREVRARRKGNGGKWIDVDFGLGDELLVV